MLQIRRGLHRLIRTACAPVDAVDPGETDTEIIRHRDHGLAAEVVKHKAGFGQGNQLAANGLGDAEGNVAAIFVQVHQADFKYQSVTGKGFTLVGGGEVGDDDAGIVLADFLDTELIEKARTGFGDHRNH